MKFTLLVPTLDEIEGMRMIMPRVKKEWVDEILVVDGGSDGTCEYAQAAGYTVIKQKSPGLYHAYREGVERALGDVIITFSPDGNSVPEAIPKLVEKMREGYDMVIASRYLGDAKSEDDDRVTAFGNWMFTRLINGAFGGRYTDVLVMLRAWKKELFSTFEDPGLAGADTMLSVKCAKLKKRVAEIPADEPARIGGARKMRPFFNGLSISLMIVREMLHAEGKGGPASGQEPAE